MEMLTTVPPPELLFTITLTDFESALRGGGWGAVDERDGLQELKARFLVTRPAADPLHVARGPGGAK